MTHTDVTRPRKAQLRTRTGKLLGAPKGKALPDRILLARRQLGLTGYGAEVNLWRDALLEVRCYSFGNAPVQTLVLPNHMLGELAAFVIAAVDAMDREVHRVVSPDLVELMPPRVMPDGSRLIAHGTVNPAGGPPFGLSIGQYRIDDDGHSLVALTIGGRMQLLAMHRLGVFALRDLFAEAVAAATPPAGSA